MDIQKLVQTHGLEAFRDFEVAARCFAACNEDVLNLSVAENVLLFPQLREKIHALPKLADKNLMYEPSVGTDALRERAVGMLNETLGLSPGLDREQISGFSSTRSSLAWSMRSFVRAGSPTFLVPTPCWHGFSWVLEDFLGGTIERVETTSRNNFTLTLEAIQKRYVESWRHRGYPPSAVLLTNPGNPVGRNLAPEVLEEIAEWVLTQTDMHLVSDEIYAHAQPVEKPGSPYVSALQLAPALQEKHWKRVHVVWGFAKDFGLSGFRIGLYLCRDRQSHEAVSGSAQWSPFDSYNSATLAFVLGEKGHDGTALMKEYRSELLRRQFRAVREALDRGGVPYNRPVDASVFFWLDLRKYLGRVPTSKGRRALEHVELLGVGATDDREEALRTYLVDEACVDLAPGTNFLFSEPGFFRLCYTAADTRAVVEGVARVARALAELDG